MIELNLTANTESEKRILEYLQNNVSETLADKVNNGTPFEKDGKPLFNKKTLATKRENLQKKVPIPLVSKIPLFTVGRCTSLKKNPS